MKQGAIHRLLVRSRALLLDTTLRRFAIVGLTTTALDLGLFGALAVVAGIMPVVANIVSYSSGIVASFILNRGWTFGERRSEAAHRHAIKFVVTNLAGLAISTAIVALLVLALDVPRFAAKGASLPVVFAWNYALARFWVFR